MAIFTLTRWLFIVCGLLTLTLLSTGEIHRIRKQSSNLKIPRHQHSSVDTVSSTRSSSTEGEGSYLSTSQEQDTDDLRCRNDYVCAALATLIVGLTGIFPLALPIDTKQVGDGTDATKRLNLFLSFAVGGLLGDVFLHLLPEGFSHFKPADRSARVTHGVFVIAGMLMFYILEVIFSDKKEEQAQQTSTASPPMSNGHALPNGITTTVANGVTTTVPNGITTTVANGITTTTAIQRTPHKKDLKNGLHKDTNANKVRENGVCGHSPEEKPHVGKKQVTGYLNLLANFIDNFTHGLAVGGSFMVSSKVGWHTTLAILLHEAPHEIGDFAILLRSGFTRWEAAKAQLTTAVGGIIGCSVALLAESAEVAGTNSAWILPFTSGGFLNIALVTIVPDLMKETSAKESFKQVLCLVLGVLIMGLVNVVSEH